MVRDLTSIPGFSDPVSSLSHLLGAVIFTILSVPLFRRGVRAGGERGRLVSLLVFAFSAVFLLCMSAVFHLLDPAGPARPILQRLDHAAIFGLIAGTFTPMHMILFRGPWRWGMLAFIWAVAAAGITFKSVYFTSTPETTGTVLYLSMGGVGVISALLVTLRFGFLLSVPLLLGGVVYALGACIDLFHADPLISGVVRSHEVFHFAVLVGLGLHWRFVWNIADRHAFTSPARED